MACNKKDENMVLTIIMEKSMQLMENTIIVMVSTNEILTLSARGPTLESDVCRRQILTSKVDPRTERLKYL